MFWNTLADVLATDFPKVPKEYLAWDFRRNLYEQEARYKPLSSNSLDIVSLVEVDHPKEWLDILQKVQSKHFKFEHIPKINKYH